MKTLSHLLLSLCTIAAAGAAELHNDATFTGTLTVSAVSNKSTVRSDLGLAIGTDVQGYHATLAALAGNTSGTLALTSVTLNLAGLASTPITAANITGTLPAVSGVNLTNLNASNLASGTVPAARGGAGTVSGILKGNGTGTVSQASSTADYMPYNTTLAALAANTSASPSFTAISPTFGPTKLGNSGTTIPLLKFGTATLSGGTVTVSDTAAVGTMLVWITGQQSTASGACRLNAVSNGVSFTIVSSNGADTGVVAWLAIYP